MTTITINPATRLEGHIKISIFLDSTGRVENAYFQMPELRGFEVFCMGRRAELLPQITSRICGVCPTAHHMASTKALDACFNVEPTPTAKKLRELWYSGGMVYDHTLNFYFLAGPDFIVGPKAPPSERNILGVIKRAGLDVAKEVIKHRAYGQKVVSMLGGKATHPAFGLPGGVSKGLTEEERSEIERMMESSVKFAKFTLKIWNDVVLKNKEYVDLVKSDAYSLKTYSMGLVDEKNRVNFYDGMVRVVDPSGREFVKFKAAEYLNVIAEHVEPWSYGKFPYLKKVGWKGFTEGPDSGIFRVGPLARLNAAEGMATPLAQEEYEKMYETLGGKPVHSILAYSWARLIELLYAAERASELAGDKEILSKDIRNKPGEPGEGAGVVEAPRGTLYHHYKLDKEGVVEEANLVVATTHNNPSINMSVRNAAKAVISEGKADEGILNMVEMAMRAYDPCIACATHFAIGDMPLEVKIYDHRMNLVKVISR